MRLAVTLLSFTAAVSTANANVLISGSGPFGTLTDASITIPAGNDSPIGLSQTSNYSQTFDVTVTGSGERHFSRVGATRINRSLPQLPISSVCKND